MSGQEKESFPLCWPDGWTRTRPTLRRVNNVWKKTFGAYRDELISEVERMNATTMVLSTNIPLTIRGLPREGYNPPDPGVAMYFTREAREDLGWQDVLELPPMPGIEQIESHFTKLAKKYHPDVGGDLAIFQRIVRAREQGKNWALGKRGDEHEYVLACDLFTEVRLNMHAIGLTIIAMRQIERCGASSMLERAFRGFRAALPAKGETS